MRQTLKNVSRCRVYRELGRSAFSAKIFVHLYIYIYIYVKIHVAYIMGLTCSGRGHSSQDPQTASAHPHYPRAPAALPLPRDRLGEDSWLRSKGSRFKAWRFRCLCDTDRMPQWSKCHKVDREGRRRERERGRGSGRETWGGRDGL